MKSYLGLVPISARVHRRQSRMTRICIILAVFLVTSIFSMMDMYIRGETIAMINKHGNWHINLQNVSEDEAEMIGRRKDVAETAWLDEINLHADKDYYIDDCKTILYGTTESYITKIRNYPTEGSCPQNDSEVMLSLDAKKLFGINIGDSITFNTPAGDFDYTVSGFCEDETDLNEMIDGCCIYMNMNAFHKICSANGEDSHPAYYIQFQEGTNLRKAIDAVKRDYGLAEENVAENTAVLGLTGASSHESVKGLYPLVAALFLLILVSGVLMISSCMNSNVAQRTKFFGMMRCIGASRQQIIRFVRLEALNWCTTSIPAGCLLGVVTCWVLSAILRLFVKGEFTAMPLWGVSASGIIFGVLVGIVTVFIAAHTPAKQAAKVSPVSAVSGNAETTKNVDHAANTRFFKVETTLGIHHAVAARKNLIFMTGSFALTIALFLFFSACLDLVHKLLPSATNFAPDFTIASQDNTNSISKSLIDEISEIPGVQDTFGTMYTRTLPVQINGKDRVIDLISYEEFMMNDSKKSVASGDLSKVYGDSEYAMIVFNQDNHLDVGDKIKIGDEELEIACVLSFGIGNIGDTTSIICSEETFRRLTGEQKYTMVNVILEKDAPQETADAVCRLAGENEIADRRQEYKDTSSSYWVFRLAAYGFLAIISLITVLNIMNSISMSVSARINQYGAMRAVGMGNRQVTKMIAAEAGTYAVCGTIAGYVLGLFLHYLIYEKAIITHFGGTWKIPVSSMAVILLLVLTSCVAAVYAPAKRIRNMAVTDTIHEL